MYDFSIRARYILLFVSYLWPKSKIDFFKATSSLLSVNVIVTAFTLIEAGRCFLASFRMRENHWYCSIYSSLFKQKLLIFCGLSIIETRHTIHQVVQHWTTVAFVSLTLLCLSAVSKLFQFKFRLYWSVINICVSWDSRKLQVFNIRGGTYVRVDNCHETNNACNNAIPELFYSQVNCVYFCSQIKNCINIFLIASWIDKLKLVLERSKCE